MTITPTLITKQMLIDQNACQEWVNIFAYRKPRGLRIETKQDIVDAINLGGFGPVIGWLTKLQVVDNIDLSDADLSGANLRGADLSGADLSVYQLQTALIEKERAQ